MKCNAYNYIYCISLTYVKKFHAIHRKLKNYIESISANLSRSRFFSIFLNESAKESRILIDVILRTLYRVRGFSYGFPIQKFLRIKVMLSNITYNIL